MKKLLTILALALVLCLGISVALAATWNDLSDADKAAIKAQLNDKDLADSASVTIVKEATCHSEAVIYVECIDESHPQNVRWGGAGFHEVNLPPTAHNMAVEGYYYDEACTKPVPELDKDMTDQEVKEIICELTASGREVWVKKVCVNDGCDEGVFGDAYATTSLVGKTHAGHTWVDRMILAPTCQHAGAMGQICSVCEKIRTKADGTPYQKSSIDPIPHNYVEVQYDPNVIPNCTNNLTANYRWVCDMCGKAKTTNYPESKQLTMYQILNSHAIEDWYDDPSVNWGRYYVDTDYTVVEVELNADGEYVIIDEDFSHENLNVETTDEGHCYVPIKVIRGNNVCMPNFTYIYECKWCHKQVKEIYGDDKPYYVSLGTKNTDCYNGVETLQCVGCKGKYHANKQVPVKHEDHIWDVANKENYVPATCTKAGSYIVHCLYHPEVTKKVTINAIGHLYTDWELVQMGTADGATTLDDIGWADYTASIYNRKCIICGEVDRKVVATKENLDKYASKMGWKYAYTVKATCLNPEYDVYTNTSEALVWDEDGDLADVYYIDGVPAYNVYKGTYGPHTWAEVKTLRTEPTCTAEGKIVYICSKCGMYDPDAKENGYDLSKFSGAYKIETTEKKAHNFVDGVCTVCGEKKTVEPGDPAYNATAAFDKDSFTLTGKATKVEGTKDAKTLVARITYFKADGTYVCTAASVVDGAFSNMNTEKGIAHISVVLTNSGDVRPGNFEKYSEKSVEIDVK